jgi:hypothetical protein
MYDRNRNELVVDGKGLGRDAQAREDVAAELTQEAVRQAQRALVGVLAVPASVALGLAAGVTWTAAFLERGFEVFERSFERVLNGTMSAREREALVRAERGEVEKQQPRS